MAIMPFKGYRFWYQSKAHVTSYEWLILTYILLLYH